MASAGTITVTLRVRDEASPILAAIAAREARKAEIRNARRVNGWTRYQLVSAR
jgi:hypothetical protein